MALVQERDQDQLRETASRIATLIRTGEAELEQLTAALPHGGELANLLVEYSSRWFNTSKGDSVLVKPELYWQITDSDQSPTGSGPAPVLRTRHMLLLLVMEYLSNGKASGTPAPATPAQAPRPAAPQPAQAPAASAPTAEQPRPEPVPAESGTHSGGNGFPNGAAPGGNPRVTMLPNK